MSDELDGELLGRFRQVREPVDGALFTARVMERIARERRRARLSRFALIGGTALAAGLLAPVFVSALMTLMDSVAQAVALGLP